MIIDHFHQNPELPGDPINFIGSKTGVLLIHGFTATTAEVRLLAGYFIKLNFTVIAPLLPGHGTTPKDLNKTKFVDWTNCVENNYSILREKCDSVIVGGESMGGVLSLWLAEKYSNISALLLFSTALSVGKLKYSKLLKYFSPIIDKNIPDDELAWKGYTVYPLWAADQFYRLTKNVKRNLSDVITPTIIFQGAFDKTIDSSNMRLIYDGIQSKTKQMEVMNNSGHVMLLDQEIEIIKIKTQAFLQNLNILSNNAGL
ncbi:MAG: alpha/beta fold hydrolase [Pelolinea sp.]|nr:alpha/beta fold hydrolase [Pelolinea sp.]